VPKSWEKTFFNWMENIQPWCVSRQLWWGHRIPVWYGPAPEDAARGSQVALHTPTNRAFIPEAMVIVASDDEQARLHAAELYGIAPEAIGFAIDAWEASEKMATHRAWGEPVQSHWLYQDPDVLDTWFSSALWPFATLGWPEENPSPPSGGEGQRSTAMQGEGGVVASASVSPLSLATSGRRPFPPEGGEGSLLSRHYPNDVLISGFDILFFWDARMLMQGIHFMNQAPWKRLYLHGLVRAPDGQKMSKSKGNVVDPLGLIDTYGADALRFFMAAMESQGRDIKMDDARLEGYRNFATKLWNATRFCQANGIGASATLEAPDATLPVNRWIIGEVVETVTRMEEALAALRFDDAANAILHFVWDDFCDWYLEWIKNPIVHVEDGNLRPGPIEDESKVVAGWVLDQILVMLHPFMPFITEELWHSQNDRRNELIVAQWPNPQVGVETEARAEMKWSQDLVTAIRSARAEMNLPPKFLDLVIRASSLSDRTRDFGRRNQAAIERMARVRFKSSTEFPDDEINVFDFDAADRALEAKDQIQSGSMTIALEGFEGYCPLAGVIDLDAERARLSKAIEVATKDRDSLAARLANPAFAERAKPEAVAKATEDHAARAAEVERLSAALARLG
jgi:valyl-tRNA synthetase